MNILVTGGAGFVGIPLVQALVKAKHQVTVFDFAPKPGELRQLRIRYVKGDVRSTEAVRHAMTGMDAVFHLAALVPISRAGREFYSVNAEGTRNVLEAARATKVKKVVHLSSSAVYYGTRAKPPLTEKTRRIPLGDYGQSKLEAERVCEAFRKRGLDITIIRPRTTVGTGRAGVFSLLFDWAKDNVPIPLIGSGSNRFQLISVDDLVRACLLVLKPRAADQDFNVGAAEYRTIREDLEQFLRRVGSRSTLLTLNPSVSRTLLRLLDRLQLSPLVELHYETPDHDFFYDTKKARRLLNFRPQDSNIEALVTAYRAYSARSASSGSLHRRGVSPKILSLAKFFLQAARASK